MGGGWGGGTLVKNLVVAPFSPYPVTFNIRLGNRQTARVLSALQQIKVKVGKLKHATTKTDPLR